MPYLGNGLTKFTTADDLTVSGTSELKDNVTVTGDVTASGTLLPTGDTAAGDDAAIGFTSAEGLILTGQGSTSDITVKNDADATVFTVPTGTDDILFPDSAKAMFGASSDLQIYHDGSSSYVQDTGTGNLVIDTNGAGTYLMHGSEIMASFVADGAVGLRHDNSEKLATTSSGVDITGAFTATDQCTISSANNTSQLVLKSTDADGSLGPKLDLVRDSSSPADGDNCGQINFFIDNDAGQSIQYGDVFVGATDVSDSTESAHMTFSTMKAGSRNSRMKLHSDETVFNEDSVDVDFRVESDGNANMLHVDAGNDTVLFGKSSPDFEAAGVEIASYGRGAFTRASGTPLFINRETDDGDCLTIQKDNVTIGSIGVASGRPYFTNESNFAIRLAGNALEPAAPAGSSSDNSESLGASGARWSQLFAGTTTISTSDETEKQNITSLKNAEITAAKAISKLFKTFKFKDSVTSKGDDARTHTGVIAQQVQTAMTDAGLDASKYAFWCSDTWWETTAEVAAVEADKDNEIEAKDAYTRVEQYYTEEEAPEGATKRTRLGVRYPELLAFIGAATEQRLADIETRLAALES